MGGGGSSGAVSWPEYLQNTHAGWMTHGDPSASHYFINQSMVQVMNSAIGSSPYTGLEAYIPDSRITAWEASISAFAALLSGLDEVTDWTNLYGHAKGLLAAPPDGIVVDDLEVDDIAEIDDLVVDDITAIGDLEVADVLAADATGVTDAEIILDVDAFANQIDDEILIKVLPRFKRGMQDINAVVSSAFVIGSSNIEGFRNRDVDKHNSGLRVNAAMKNADVGVSNMGKDVQIELGNMSKDVQVGLGNISKSLDIGKVDISKDIDVGKTNITKDLKISELNANKDLQVGIANLTKNTQVGEINLKSAVEYERMYLEGTGQMMQLMLQRIQWEENTVNVIIESGRIGIVAKKEQKDMDNTFDIDDASWDLEVFQHGANLLAASSGGVGGVQKEKPSAAASAIGGALGTAVSGALIGSKVGGTVGSYWGAAIGAVVGAAGGLIARNN